VTSIVNREKRRKKWTGQEVRRRNNYTWPFIVLNAPRLVRCQCHHHLHHFNLSVCLPSIDVTTVFHQITQQFPSRRPSEKRWIVFLLKYASLIPNDDTVAIHLLFHKCWVTRPIHREKQSSVRHVMDFNFLEGIIHYKEVGVWTALYGIQLVLDSFMDELNRQVVSQCICR